MIKYTWAKLNGICYILRPNIKFLFEINNSFRMFCKLRQELSRLPDSKLKLLKFIPAK